MLHQKAISEQLVRYSDYDTFHDKGDINYNDLFKIQSFGDIAYDSQSVEFHIRFLHLVFVFSVCCCYCCRKKC